MSIELPDELKVRDEPRRLRFHRYQWVGLPIIFLIPLLALLGVFGESREVVEDATSDLTLRAEYATRYRYKQIESLEVVIENRSDRSIDTLIVSFDPPYVRQFSEPIFIPDVGEPYDVELLNVKPGEPRSVWGQLQGESYGSHRGSIKAYPKAGGDTATVTLRTIIFP